MMRLPNGPIAITRIESAEDGRVRILSCQTGTRVFDLVFRECLIFRWETPTPPRPGQTVHFHLYTPRLRSGDAIYPGCQAVMIMSGACSIKIVFRDWTLREA